jgi:hypothetical protein
MHTAADVERIAYFGRNSVLLSNEKVRAIVDDLGGMMPEFSLKKGKGAVNAHGYQIFAPILGCPGPRTSMGNTGKQTFSIFWLATSPAARILAPIAQWMASGFLPMAGQRMSDGI